MATRRDQDPTKYVDPRSIKPREDPPALYDFAMAAPVAVLQLDKSAIKNAQAKPDWKLYKLTYKEGNPVIVREICDRCGKNWVPPSWRKLRALDTETCGTIYLESGLCKDCINASIYCDKYFRDMATPDTFSELQRQFYQYAEEYERAWRAVIAAAPAYIMTEEEWQKRCNFFNGCALCGGKIEARAMYFPRHLNGSYSPWNVIPLCSHCMQLFRIRRSSGKKSSRHKVFSTVDIFQKSKEIRVYLLNVMDKYDIYREPLTPYRKRFFETKKFEERFI